jgi:DinB superfamily
MDTVYGRPEPIEAPEYFSKYILNVPDGDIRQILRAQLIDTLTLMDSISNDRSCHRHADGKWSIREVLGHINDTERVFVFRAFWFARGFEGPLPNFEQDVAAAHASADTRGWGSHVAEFRSIRGATLAFFQSLPAERWLCRGVAGGNLFMSVPSHTSSLAMCSTTRRF